MPTTRTPHLTLSSVAGVWVLFISGQAHAQSFSTGYDFGDLLTKSIKFYEAQVSGDIPSWNRVSWRNDCCQDDGDDVNADLSGGWLDAGDNVKFNFPMAWGAVNMAWSYLEYPEAFGATGDVMGTNDTHLKNNLRYVCDYFIACHPSANVFHAQVGLGVEDHKYWLPPERNPAPRPTAFTLTPSKPGTDLACGVAAALAASSIVFAEDDPTYSATLLTHARQLYSFGDTYRGRYSDHSSDVQRFYRSFNGFDDELVWAAVWLYKATGESAFLNAAENRFEAIWYRNGYTFNWDDSSYGCYVLLSQIPGTSRGQAFYRDQVQRWLDQMLPGGNQNYSPGGLLYIPGDEFGPAWLSISTVFCSLVYCDSVLGSGSDFDRYRNWAIGQLDYVLGNNPSGYSMVVGFGGKNGTYPLRPHHRAATGPNSDGSWRGQGDGRANVYVIDGALVGGAKRADDSFPDLRSDVRSAEMSVATNGPLIGVAAAFVGTEPVLVGRAEAGPSIDGIVDGSYRERREIGNLLFGEVSDGADLSAGWRALWDAEALYVYVDVFDEQQVNDSGAAWYLDDTIEVYLDLNNSKGTSYDGVDDRQFGFRFGGSGAIAGSGGGSVVGIESVIVETVGGYALEARIPWSVVGAPPDPEDPIGFEVHVIDDDNGGDREAKIAWNGTSDNAWRNPSLFGTVTLTAGAGEDTIEFIGLPDQWVRGEVTEVTVRYSATVSRDLLVEFFTSSFGYIVGERIAVQPGEGTVIAEVTVPGETPLGATYRASAKIVPRGGSFNERLDEDTSLPGLSVVDEIRGAIEIGQADASGRPTL